MSLPDEMYWSSKHGRIINYWALLAEEYGLPEVVVKMLYEDWDTKAYRNFGAYVAMRKAEIREQKIAV